MTMARADIDYIMELIDMRDELIKLDVQNLLPKHKEGDISSFYNDIVHLLERIYETS